MKFIGIILLLLTSIFLIACSANQASNNINNSEIKELGKKYGGVYIFNQKFVDEIEKREKERSLYMDNFFKNNKRNFKRDDLAIMDKKLPQILSNGKQYHTINTYQKAVNLSNSYINKIIDYIGQENYYKFTPDINVWSFYIDDNNSIVPIEMTVTYNYKVKKYGLFGDEGRGFSLSKGEIHTAKGGNKFILNNNKFEKVK